MTDRYPGYDVLSKRTGLSWNDESRRVINQRLAVPQEPRFFDAAEWQTLGAVCGRIVPEPADRPAVPLAAYVDEKMFTDAHEGYRHAELPEQRIAWKRGLAALRHESEGRHQRPFHELGPSEQDSMLKEMEGGSFGSAALEGMPAASFFHNRVVPDIVNAYYAHPTAWTEMGYGGPASPRGYVRLRLERRDPWEAAEATPGNEDAARRENARVR